MRNRDDYQETLSSHSDRKLLKKRESNRSSQAKFQKKKSQEFTEMKSKIEQLEQRVTDLESELKKYKNEADTEILYFKNCLY